ncbi:S-layer homology domain-containing protein [Brachybacterium sp. EF45031]|uniref:S-layer homology domain-containing protein n=1 Tax=Brachybacterium sillae TaxID=2810536 RepID=UPI00217CC441|nr:S-layer homology domain-containing protein [Brachybacterium sillae]MCS6711215.1 S-layer homology domain-containing protein [Brachybacterium sillae]
MTPRHHVRRRSLLTAAAAAPAGTLALSHAAVAAPLAPATPTDTTLEDLPLAEAEALVVDGRPVRRLSGRRATMAAVSWPADGPTPQVQVRGQYPAGAWSPWLRLQPETDPVTGRRADATELAWLGEVASLDVRATARGRDVAATLTAHLVRTAPETTDADVASGEAARATGRGERPGQQAGAAGQVGGGVRGGAPVEVTSTALLNPPTPPLVGAPGFVTRGQWGADETLVRETTGAYELKSVIVHHTAGSNSYTAAESAQVVRGILAYHTRTLGWADLGYNVLVDKYGQIFEGRSGGLQRNIVGAHARGFNTGTFGISVIGDHSSVAPSAAAQQAVAQMIGWKLLSTFRPDLSAQYPFEVKESSTRFALGATVQLPRLLGHRDVNDTDCPGDALYTRLGSLEDQAQTAIESGFRAHYDAFLAAGGEDALGTVFRSAHTSGAYTVTKLTRGLVLGSGTGAAVATRSMQPIVEAWQPSWGRPLAPPTPDGSRTLQAFEQGVAVLEGTRVRFVARRFRDVPPTLQFFTEIHDLAARGITTGWPDGTYRPFLPIQRDAMVVFVYRALGSPAFTGTSPFRDVSASTMYSREIAWAAAQGIVTGWPDGTFRPTAPVQRAAVAAFLYRAAGAKATDQGLESGFRDVPPTHQFAREITWLASTGISTGWPDGTFRPWDPITRDAMAAFMLRWLAFLGR